MKVVGYTLGRSLLGGSGYKVKRAWVCGRNFSGGGRGTNRWTVQKGKRVTSGQARAQNINNQITKKKNNKKNQHVVETWAGGGDRVGAQGTSVPPGSGGGGLRNSGLGVELGARLPTNEGTPSGGGGGGATWCWVGVEGLRTPESRRKRARGRTIRDRDWACQRPKRKNRTGGEQGCYFRARWGRLSTGHRTNKKKKVNTSKKRKKTV